MSVSTCDLIGWGIGAGGIVLSVVTYLRGKAMGHRETERSVRLGNLSALRREIGEARTFFNDWFLPITHGSGVQMADPDLRQEAGKKIDAIRTTWKAVHPHLKEDQKTAVDALIKKFGSDYLQFAYACKNRYPDTQKAKAQEMQSWFAGEMENILNGVLTER